MATTVLLQPAYFAPIAQYAAIVQSENILLEVYDHFTKQTYRTRCYISAANGKLLLNVPVNKEKAVKAFTKDIQISYAEDWQKLHLKSLQSAYSSSPFFEFYEADLLPIFKTKYQYLSELHKACDAFVMDALQEQKKITYTKEYLKGKQTDLRTWIDAKKKLPLHFPTYVQIFDDKHGFLPNLSILDLIFMEGPNAVTYLEKLNLKHAFS